MKPKNENQSGGIRTVQRQEGTPKDKNTRSWNTKRKQTHETQLPVVKIYKNYFYLIYLKIHIVIREKYN